MPKTKFFFHVLIFIIPFFALVPISQAVSPEDQKITLSDPDSGFLPANLDYFGFDVAYDGDTMIVGAPYDDDNFADSGSAYVYTFNGTSWIFQAKLTAPDAEAADLFGWSVALDGDTALIGSHYGNGSMVDSGSAYIFVRSNGIWDGGQPIPPPSGGQTYDIFGYSVAIENGTALIGATDAGIGGQAYIYTDSGSSWDWSQTLIPNDNINNNDFGRFVALDNNNLLVGAIRADGNNVDSGAAYVFTYDGSAWSQQAKLTASDGALDDVFGIHGAIDGNNILISADLDDDFGIDSGSVYAFDLSTCGGASCTQVSKFHSNIAQPSGRFGGDVDLEGTTAIIGSRFGGGGNGQVFTFDGTKWNYLETFFAGDANGNDMRLGGTVSLQGNTVIMGGYFGDVYSGESISIADTGAVYAFTIGRCFIDAPSEVNEGEQIIATTTCNAMRDVYGFEYVQSVDPSSPIILPQTSIFTDGNIFDGLSTLTLVNDINDGFAQSLQSPETPISGSHTLGSLTYDTDDPGIAIFQLDPVILGNISGVQIPISTTKTTSVTIVDLLLASVSGSARRETGADVTSAITVEVDTASPDITGVAGGFFTFAYDNESVALDATLTVNAPGHVSCETLDLGLTDNILNTLTPITLLAGDVDNNDTVDITDGSIIVQERFLPGSAPVGTTPDLNEDTNINVLDIIHVGRNFATVGPVGCQ